ncbi:MAG: alpha/beta hydrolase [Reichenbachiella sp.]
MKLIIFTITLVVSAFNARAQDFIIPLWNQVPNSKPCQHEETITITDAKRIRHVTNPTIEVYLPSRSNSTQQAVLICPGGGYSKLSYDKEGTDVAKWLNGLGIAGIVLKYRLPEECSNIIPHQSPIMDATQGLILIRAHAETWGIDASNVGVMGFSAGGHLAASLAVHSDNIEKPNFMVLIYPVISMKSSITHLGSKTNLLGSNPSSALVDYYSIEDQVTKDTPTTFIIHSQDDQSVSIKNSLRLYTSLCEYEIPSELHTFRNGGHGYSLAIHDPYLNTWTDLLESWLPTIENNK